LTCLKFCNLLQNQFQTFPNHSGCG